MPKVGGKKFPYTAAGKAAARRHRGPAMRQGIGKKRMAPKVRKPGNAR